MSENCEGSKCVNKAEFCLDMKKLDKKLLLCEDCMEYYRKEYENKIASKSGSLSVITIGPVQGSFFSDLDDCKSCESPYGNNVARYYIESTGLEFCSDCFEKKELPYGSEKLKKIAEKREKSYEEWIDFRRRLLERIREGNKSVSMKDVHRRFSLRKLISDEINESIRSLEEDVVNIFFGSHTKVIKSYLLEYGFYIEMKYQGYLSFRIYNDFGYNDIANRGDIVDKVYRHIMEGDLRGGGESVSAEDIYARLSLRKMISDRINESISSFKRDPENSRNRYYVMKIGSYLLEYGFYIEIWNDVDGFDDYNLSFRIRDYYSIFEDHVNRDDIVDKVYDHITNKNLREKNLLEYRFLNRKHVCE